jgi:hypothetical protein
MNKTYTRWSTRTGKIVDVVNIPDQSDAYDLYHTSLYEGVVDGTDYYMVEGVPTLRPDMHLSISRTTLSVANEEFTAIAGIPVGSELTVSHPDLGSIMQVITATSYIYKPQVPGVFTFTVSCFPYKDVTFDVTAYSLEL